MNDKPRADAAGPAAPAARASFPSLGTVGFAGSRDIFFAAVALPRLPILVTDPSLPDNPVVFANQASCALTGYAAAELLGRNSRLLQGPQTDPAAVAALREAVAARRQVAVELVNYRRDGTPFWNALFISPVFGPGGELIYFLASQLDISRRHAAERALARSRQLDGLDALAGGLAHEFNNLLTVIQGNLEPLLRVAPDARTVTRLERVRAAADRAAVLTRSIGAFARCQSLEQRTFDLAALLRALLPEMADTLGGGCPVVLELPDGALSVRADPEQLGATLHHILRNAREATPGGGPVRVRLGVRPSAGVRPAEVELSVSDAGSGMNAPVAAHALEPFFTTKRSDGGIGLGLPMASGFMRQSGGRLELSSSACEGTTVRLIFPRRPALPPGLPCAEPGESVLVMEPDADLRALVVATLEDLGYTLRACASPEAAVQCAGGEARVDLLVADIDAAVGQPALAQCLAELHPAIAALFTCSRPAPQQGDLLHKPFSMTELAQHVRARLNDPHRVTRE